MRITENDIELYFEDLKEDMQKKFLDAMGIKTKDEGNYDVFPIALVPLPEIDNEIMSGESGEFKWKCEIIARQR